MGEPNTSDKLGTPFTTAEDAILRRYYPQQGARATMERLSGRSIVQVCNRARRIGLKYLGKKRGGCLVKNDAYGLPSQDFANEHRHWQATYIPPQPRCEFRTLGARL